MGGRVVRDHATRERAGTSGKQTPYVTGRVNTQLIFAHFSSSFGNRAKYLALKNLTVGRRTINAFRLSENGFPWARSRILKKVSNGG